MKILYAIPSANLEQARKSLPEWRRRGYQIAVLIDASDSEEYVHLADYIVSVNDYHGYSWAIRRMMTEGLFADKDIVVTGGDDVYPDNRVAHEIAIEFFDRFPNGYGVMQPTGDGHGCDEICGSPWMGRLFVDTINGGNGPFWSEYRHYFCDQEMKLVTQALGILWQRSDLVQRHCHWSWTTGKRPSHMKRHVQYHDADRRLFLYRKIHGFPGHAPLRGKEPSEFDRREETA